MYRSIISTTVPRAARSATATRALHSSPAAYKTVTEKVKETAQDINIKTGRVLAKGIEKGEEATEKVKDASSIVIGTAKDKADEASEVSKQKANQASADAKEKKEEFKRSL